MKRTIVFLMGFLLAFGSCEAKHKKTGGTVDKYISNILCFDNYLSPKTVFFQYDIDTNSVEVIVPVVENVGKFAYSLRTNDLITIQKAIAKAKNWMRQAKRKHMTQINKALPFKMNANVYLKTDYWMPYGSQPLQFDFVVMKAKGRIMYLFQMGLVSRDNMKAVYEPYIVIDLEKQADSFAYALSMKRFLAELERQKDQENAESNLK